MYADVVAVRDDPGKKESARCAPEMTQEPLPPPPPRLNRLARGAMRHIRMPKGFVNGLSERRKLQMLMDAIEDRSLRPASLRILVWLLQDTGTQSGPVGCFYTQYVPTVVAADTGLDKRTVLDGFNQLLIRGHICRFTHRVKGRMRHCIGFREFGERPKEEN